MIHTFSEMIFVPLSVALCSSHSSQGLLQWWVSRFINENFVHKRNGRLSLSYGPTIGTRSRRDGLMKWYALGRKVIFAIFPKMIVSVWWRVFVRVLACFRFSQNYWFSLKTYLHYDGPGLCTENGVEFFAFNYNENVSSGAKHIKQIRNG